MKLQRLDLTDMEKDHLNCKGLFTICQDIHMSMTGAGEFLSLDSLNKYYTWITYKIEHWQDYLLSSTMIYDNAVKQVVLVTLHELVVWFDKYGDQYYGEYDETK